MQGLLHNTGPTAHVRASGVWVGRQRAFCNVQGQSVYGLNTCLSQNSCCVLYVSTCVSVGYL